MSKKVKKEHFFLSLLLSYMLVLLIPMLIAFSTYHISINAIKDDAKIKNLASLEKLRDIMDGYLQNMTSGIRSIALSDSVTRLMNIDPEANSLPFDIISLQKSLSSYNITNELIAGYFIYLKGLNSIITPDTYYNEPQVFYEQYLNMDGMEYNQWYEDYLNSQRTKGFLPSKSTNFRKVKKNFILYTMPLPVIDTSRALGNITVLIDERKLENIIDSTHSGEGGWYYILDEKGNLISGSSVVKIFDLNPQETGYINAEIDNEEYLVTYTTSASGQWRYVFGVPMRIVLKNAIYIERLIWIIIVILSLLGYWVSQHMARRNAKPVQEIVAWIKGTNNENGPLRDSYGYETLKREISLLIDKNANLKLSLEQQLSLVRRAILDMLIRGNFSNQEDLVAITRHNNMDITGQAFCVVLISIASEGETIKDSMQEDINVRRILITNTATEVLDDQGFVHYVSNNIVMLLIVLKNINDEGDTPEETQKQFIQDKMKLLNDNLTELLGIKLYYAMGGIYSSQLDIYRSYKEANAVLDYLNYNKENYINWYAELPEPEIMNYYPVEAEHRLVNLIKEGSYEKAKNLLWELFAECSQKLTPIMQRQFFYELRGTILKLNSTIPKETAVSAAELMEWDGLLNGTHPKKQLEDCVLTSVQKLCERFSAQKENYNSKFKEKIINYICENFSNPQLNLAMLATNFNFSETYMSCVFKEYTGENFSTYLEKYRVNKASLLLEEDSEMTIGQIAQMVGYNSDQSFRRAFKKVVGVSPRDYRRHETS